MRELLLLLVLGCGVAADPPAATCEPAPEGFRAARSGEVVKVTRRLDPTPQPGGIRRFAESRVPESVPGTVDFGDVQLEVRADLTLCLVTGDSAE